MRDVAPQPIAASARIDDEVIDDHRDVGRFRLAEWVVKPHVEAGSAQQAGHRVCRRPRSRHQNTGGLGGVLPAALVAEGRANHSEHVVSHSGVGPGGASYEIETR